jgi:hypothetical protein
VVAPPSPDYPIAKVALAQSVVVRDSPGHGWTLG